MDAARVLASLFCAESSIPSASLLPQSVKELVTLRGGDAVVLFNTWLIFQDEITVHLTHAVPADTTIGYYLGTPTPRNDFEALKAHKGHASKYAIPRQKYILDATDTNGMLPTTVTCPFHHMRRVERGNVGFEDRDGGLLAVVALAEIEAGAEICVSTPENPLTLP
jgi:hypothetical protein